MTRRARRMLADLPGTHPGCMVAAVCYQDQLFNQDVRNLNTAGVLSWRRRFSQRLKIIAEHYPPKVEVDLSALARKARMRPTQASSVSKGDVEDGRSKPVPPLPNFEVEYLGRPRRCFSLSLEQSDPIIRRRLDTFMPLREKGEIFPFRFIFLVCFSLILPSCDETPPHAESPKTLKTNGVGFEAVITGSYEGEVSGIGALVLLPKAGYEKKGYFFLSDGQGIRAHGVTFVLPRGLTLGRHVLESPSPLDIGTVPSVRVDRDIGDSILSAGRNTSGYLDLIAFPDDEKKLGGAEVTGNFEFETEDKKGQKVSVKGKLSFKIK